MIRCHPTSTLFPYTTLFRSTMKNFDVQIGRIPPTFGAFARRTYANDNPLIGYPLAYQYLTSLRADALRSEEHTSELQSRQYLVCRLLLEKKKSANHSCNTRM